MATQRERPFHGFNFRVNVGSGDPESPAGGFRECTGLAIECGVAEYRNGNDPNNSPMKINGPYKVPDVTLKRGVIGSLNLYQWMNDVRTGSQNALRTVTIELLSEDHNDVAIGWTLSNARPIKYTGPALNGKGADVAIEELVLACERIEVA